MPQQMKDVKITVLKTTFNEDLAKEYGAEGLGRCPIHQAGQVFISHGGAMPEGVCGEAWSAFGKYCFAMAFGLENFWTDWISKPYVSINSCNDGLRPVIFKLEVMDSGE